MSDDEAFEHRTGVYARVRSNVARRTDALGTLSGSAALVGHQKEFFDGRPTAVRSSGSALRPIAPAHAIGGTISPNGGGSLRGNAVPPNSAGPRAVSKSRSSKAARIGGALTKSGKRKVRNSYAAALADTIEAQVLVPANDPLRNRGQGRPEIQSGRVGDGKKMSQRAAVAAKPRQSPQPSTELRTLAGSARAARASGQRAAAAVLRAPSVNEAVVGRQAHGFDKLPNVASDATSSSDTAAGGRGPSISPLVTALNVVAVDALGAQYSGVLGGANAARVSIGASSKCDWALSDSGVSDRHLELVARGTDMWLLAHSCITVNGRSLSGWEPVGRNVVIDVGEARLSLCAQEVGAATVAPKPLELEPVVSLPGSQLGEEGSIVGQDGGHAGSRAMRFALPPELGIESEHRNASAVVPISDGGTFTRSRIWIAAALLAMLGAAVTATASAAHDPRSSIRARPRTASAAETPLEVTAPPPIVIPLDRKSGARRVMNTKAPSLEFHAAVALSQHDLWVARTHYQRLAETDPGGTFAVFLDLVESRLRTRCANPEKEWSEECNKLK